MSTGLIGATSEFRPSASRLDWPSLVNFRGGNKAYRVTQMTGASSRLILLDAIRPSYAWLFATIAGTL